MNLTEYKVYKELDRIHKVKNSGLSPEKVIEIIQNIYEINLITPNNESVKKTIIISEEQKLIQEIFEF